MSLAVRLPSHRRTDAAACAGSHGSPSLLPFGALALLPPAGGEDDGGYGTFMASVDALVMGRHTYETVRGFGAWPYGDMRVVVLSRRGIDVPAALRATVGVRAGKPADVLRRLGAEGARRVYLDGGRTIQGFLRAGLVTETTITRIPVLLGSGILLFGPLDGDVRLGDVRLGHVETRSFPDGLVQSRYRIASGG